MSSVQELISIIKVFFLQGVRKVSSVLRRLYDVSNEKKNTEKIQALFCYVLYCLLTTRDTRESIQMQDKEKQTKTQTENLEQKSRKANLGVSNTESGGV